MIRKLLYNIIMRFGSPRTKLYATRHIWIPRRPLIPSRWGGTSNSVARILIEAEKANDDALADDALSLLIDLNWDVPIRDISGQIRHKKRRERIVAFLIDHYQKSIEDLHHLEESYQQNPPTVFEDYQRQQRHRHAREFPQTFLLPIVRSLDKELLSRHPEFVPCVFHTLGTSNKDIRNTFREFIFSLGTDSLKLLFKHASPRKLQDVMMLFGEDSIPVMRICLKHSGHDMKSHEIDAAIASARLAEQRWNIVEKGVATDEHTTFMFNQIADRNKAKFYIDTRTGDECFRLKQGVGNDPQQWFIIERDQRIWYITEIQNVTAKDPDNKFLKCPLGFAKPNVKLSMIDLSDRGFKGHGWQIPFDEQTASELVTLGSKIRNQHHR